MRYKSITILAVFATVFFIVTINSSCANDTATGQTKQFDPAPTPEEDGWKPSTTAKGFPADLPADLPAKAIKLIPSTISEDIVNYKSENPAATAKEIADYGNRLLPVKGYNYWFDLEGLNKKKEKEARILSEETQVYPYSMPLVRGSRASFLIFAPRNDSCCCGYFYGDLPVTRVTGQTVTFISGGKTYAVLRPKELGRTEQYAAIDLRKPSKNLRTWQIPYETYPQGISADGKQLYVEGPAEDILLEISFDGSFRLVAKDVVKSSEGEQCSIPLNPKDHYEDCLKFKIARRTFYIKYSGPCT
jgi:hypothetical protein